ncbi:hypothetical protein ACFQ5J_08885 [Lacticaseibacillus baoqingensis]|uniref:Uncharacterized protein n=1 Tax=Lacticaseibacillus baoqingensis TaxID=2486013 RepID=A0ABW4E7Z9_9LACO|nr:hypothetical protein [Lacticaseibacillus baoqingensis]
MTKYTATIDVGRYHFVEGLQITPGALAATRAGSVWLGAQLVMYAVDWAQTIEATRGQYAHGGRGRQQAVFPAAAYFMAHPGVDAITAIRGLDVKTATPHWFVISGHYAKPLEAMMDDVWAQALAADADVATIDPAEVTADLTRPTQPEAK